MPQRVLCLSHESSLANASSAENALRDELAALRKELNELRGVSGKRQEKFNKALFDIRRSHAPTRARVPKALEDLFQSTWTFERRCLEKPCFFFFKT